jgi:hypothetical protein
MQVKTEVLGFEARCLLYLRERMAFLAFLRPGLQILTRYLHDAMVNRSEFTVPLAAHDALHVYSIVLRSYGYRSVGQKSNQQKQIV